MVDLNTTTTTVMVGGQAGTFLPDTSDFRKPPYGPLFEYFSMYGYVKSVCVPFRNKTTTEHNGYAIVEFDNEMTAEKVICLSPHTIQGFTLYVSVFRKRFEIHKNAPVLGMTMFLSPIQFIWLHNLTKLKLLVSIHRKEQTQTLELNGFESDLRYFLRLAQVKLDLVFDHLSKKRNDRYTRPSDSKILKKENHLYVDLRARVPVGISELSEEYWQCGKCGDWVYNNKIVCLSPVCKTDTLTKEVLKKKKWCINYYYTGKCQKTNCRYDHVDGNIQCHKADWELPFQMVSNRRDVYDKNGHCNEKDAIKKAIRLSLVDDKVNHESQSETTDGEEESFDGVETQEVPELTDTTQLAYNLSGHSVSSVCQCKAQPRFTVVPCGHAICTMCAIASDGENKCPTCGLTYTETRRVPTATATVPTSFSSATLSTLSTSFTVQ